MIIFLNSANAPTAKTEPSLVACVQTRIDGKTRTRTATTIKPTAGTRPTPQPSDARYSITWEFTGAPNGPHAVLRFCGVWCSRHDTPSEALKAATLHNEQRTSTQED